MTSAEVLAAIIELWERKRSTDEFGEVEVEGDLQDLTAALAHAEMIRWAASVYVKAVKAEITEVVGVDRAYRSGPQIFRVWPKRTLRVTDSVGFARFLGDDVSRVFRLDDNNLRITQLKAVAEAREIGLEAIYGTFLEVEKGDPELEVLPIDKAPKFLQALEDGMTWSKEK